MIMVIAIPATLFIWFITAFLMDGQSFKDLRARMDPYHVEHAKLPMQVQEHEEGTHHMEGPAQETGTKATPAPEEKTHE